jgi:hypothetical protein
MEMNPNHPIAARPSGSAAPRRAAPVADSLLRPPRLLPGEKAADYKALRDQILGDIQPKGPLETILVRDVVDLQWEIVRLRRLKAALLRAKALEGVREILAPFGNEDDEDFAALPDQWARGDPEARQAVRGLLSPAGLGDDEIMATTLAQNLDPVERIDGLIKSGEARRNNTLDEIDRRRQALGAAIRAGVQQVEDVEFREVGGEPIAEEAA